MKAERFLLVAVLLAGMSTPTMAQKCRNEIPTLGGSTAILRNVDLSTAGALQEVMKKEKYRKAFQEILDQAGLDGQLNALLAEIDKLTDNDADSFPQGTELAWMAYRRVEDRRIRLLRDACWINKEPFLAWPITLTIDGKPRRFIIPQACLNLAELKTPTCTMTVQADCTNRVAHVEVFPEWVPGTKAAEAGGVVLTYSLAGKEKQSATGSRKGDYQWDVPLGEEGGTFTFYAEAEDDKGMKSPACTAQLSVCAPPPPKEKPCNTSCELDVSSEWGEGVGIIRITSAASPRVTDESGTAVAVTKNGEGSWIANVSHPGRYKVDASAQDSKCSSNCSATVEVKEPQKCEDCKPCCQSPWMLRTFGLYMASQGSEQTGSFRTAGNEVGKFQFELNDGLGFGFELEHRFGEDTAGGSGWGWAAGLSRTSVDTFWVFDSPNFWIMDNDRVDLTILTTGPRFHWGGGGWRWFAGPSVGYALFGTGSYADGTMKPGTFEVDFDDTLVYGGGLGFDALLSEDHCWGFTGGLEYLVFSAEGKGIDVDVNPLSAKIGIVYHF